MNSEHEKPSEQKNAYQEDSPAEQRRFIPCEAMVSGVCLLIMTYFLFHFFRPFEDHSFADPPYDLISYFYALMISLFSTPLVLVVAAWNAWRQGVNAVRNRVLIYLMLMHVSITGSLLLYLLVRISIYF